MNINIHVAAFVCNAYSVCVGEPGNEGCMDV